MTVKEHLTAAVAGHNAMAITLSKIALGRQDCGRPLAGETSRQMARDVLVELGLDWNHVLKTHEEMQPAFDRLRRGRRR